ncbi:MAG TPA: GNAT family N-acetyltransferase [Acidimicrobiales bacterium]|jgi:L-amino acid N-acyltransferase|nr:GNAT family N-acetyltransferase [Acidimicrobiales bacterium]
MTVRLAGVADAAAIRAIYNREVTEATSTFDMVPRSEADQLEWLRAHDGAHPAVVSIAADQVTGFGSISPFKERPAYATTVEDSVFVHQDHRGAGVGKMIVNELVRLATSHGFHAMIARIVGGNEASINVHKVCGFEIVGVEREVGRKFGKWLDVVEMQRLL